MALTQYMAQGDGVYVKVNRMRDGMPFAHVQYLVSLHKISSFVRS